jgi:hypothetical protein
MTQILEACGSLEDAAIQNGNTQVHLESIQWIDSTLRDLPFPDDEALRTIARVLPIAAIQLVRARGLVRQLMTIVERDLAAVTEFWTTSWPLVAELMVPALEALREATAAMDEYAP